MKCFLFSMPFSNFDLVNVHKINIFLQFLNHLQFSLSIFNIKVLRIY